MSFSSSGYGTQGLASARQVFYHGVLFQAHALALDQKEDNLGPFSFLCNCTYPVEEDLVTSSCSSNREWRSEKQVVFVIHEPALGPGLSDCDLGSNSSNLKGKICLLQTF